MSERALFVTDVDPFGAEDWRFLARAASVLDAADDLDSAVRGAASLAVSYLAESSILCLLETSGKVEWRAAAQADPERLAMLEALRDFPPDPSTANPLSLAVQSGLPQAIVLDTDAALVSAAAGDPRHLAVLRALGPVRGQVFPLAPAGAVLGLIVLAARNPVDPLRYAVMMDFAGRVAETVGRLVLRAREVRRQQVMGEAVAIVAHDLKDPLATIDVALAYVLDGVHDRKPANDDGRRVLKAARHATGRMQRLIEQLLGRARAGDDPLGVVFNEVDLARLLSELALEFEPLATSAGVTLAVNIDRPLPLIRVDSDRLTEALGNVLGNALKYTPRGGHVTLRASHVDFVVTVSVDDDGPGIALEAQAMVFRPFWRGGLDHTGSGLGLAIAKRILEAHGGDLRVQSVPGHGASFVATLPVPSSGGRPSGVPLTRSSAQSAIRDTPEPFVTDADYVAREDRTVHQTGAPITPADSHLGIQQSPSCQ